MQTQQCSLHYTNVHETGYTTLKLDKTTEILCSYFLLNISPNGRLKPLRKPEGPPYFCRNKRQEIGGKTFLEHASTSGTFDP